MINRRTLTALVAGTAIAGTLGLPAAADWREDIDVIRIATAASDNQAARRARYEPVAEFLSEKLGVEVELIVTSEHAATAEALLNGQVEAADLGTQGYAIINELQPDAIRPFATEMNLDGTVGYHSAILVRADRDDITSVEDLEGKTLGFPSQSSNSGTVSPKYFMSKQYGIDDIDAYAGQTGFSGSHNNTVIGVANGTYDAGFIWYNNEGDNASSSLVDAGEIEADELKYIWVSPVMPTNPWVVSTSLPKEAQDAIIDAVMALNDEGRDALDAMSEGNAGGLTRVTHEDYLDIIEIRNFAMSLR